MRNGQRGLALQLSMSQCFDKECLSCKDRLVSLEGSTLLEIPAQLPLHERPGMGASRVAREAPATHLFILGRDASTMLSPASPSSLASRALRWRQQDTSPPRMWLAVPSKPPRPRCKGSPHMKPLRAGQPETHLAVLGPWTASSRLGLLLRVLEPSHLDDPSHDEMRPSCSASLTRNGIVAYL